MGRGCGMGGGVENPYDCPPPHSSLQGQPGSTGMKGESGDFGPQVSPKNRGGASRHPPPKHCLIHLVIQDLVNTLPFLSAGSPRSSGPDRTPRKAWPEGELEGLGGDFWGGGVCAPHPHPLCIRQGRPGADGARGMPGDPGVKVTAGMLPSQHWGPPPPGAPLGAHPCPRTALLGTTPPPPAPGWQPHGRLGYRDPMGSELGWERGWILD